MLGLDDGATAAEVRRAYRSRLRSIHPDVSGRTDATVATAEVVAAYGVLRAEVAAEPVPAPPSDATTTNGTDAVHLIGVDTIVVPAPTAETFARLVDAAHALGEVSYLDRSTGFLEFVVTVVGGPAYSVVVSLQGRATSGTEAFVTVEPLGRGPALDVEPITSALAGLVAARWT